MGETSDRLDSCLKSYSRLEAKYYERGRCLAKVEAALSDLEKENDNLRKSRKRLLLREASRKSDTQTHEEERG